MSGIVQNPTRPTAGASSPQPMPVLNDDMLAMDVVDTLRHHPDLMAQAKERTGEEALLATLREMYRQQGIEVSDGALRDGLAALAENRFRYLPPRPGLASWLAKLYVVRQRWAPPVFAVGLMLLISLGGYFLAWKPFRQSQIAAAQTELNQALPAEMDALQQTIFNETKVQQAANDAEDLRVRGKAAAAEGNRAGAEAAVQSLTALRDALRLDYALKIVDRSGVKFGFWKFPTTNAEATNYYIVVEAVDPDGTVLDLPISNEETGKTETVKLWGLRVPKAVYTSVEADKADDGIIQRNVVGMKQFGFIEVDYTVPVLGGAVTRW